MIKLISLVWMAFSTLVYAGDKFELELSSGESINIDMYNANSDTIYLYLPSERGLGKGYVATAQQMLFEDKTLWALDLHTSYMVAPRKSSIDKFSTDDLLELIDYSKTKGFQKLFFITSGRGVQLALKAAYKWQLKNHNSNYLKGHIFHSPHLIKGKPKLGTQADYVKIAKISNLPVYLLMPQYGTKYFRTQEIVKTLKKGGSSVFVHRLKGVHGGFHMRNEVDLNKTDLQARDGLDNTYIQASDLLLNISPASLVALSKPTKTKSNYAFNEPKLTPYKGKQSIGLKLKNMMGKEVSIKDFKHQVVLINFWASWCKPCVKEIPSLVRLNEKLAKNNFKIITINVGESADEINAFKKNTPFNLPILLDESGKAVKDWGVYAYPSNFLLDKNGVIRYGYRGALEWDSGSIINTIKTLL